MSDPYPIAVYGAPQQRGSTAACVAKYALMALAGALLAGAVVLLCVGLASAMQCNCPQCPGNGGRCQNPGCKNFTPLGDGNGDGEGVFGNFLPAHPGHLALQPNALGQQADSCGEARNVPLYAQSARLPVMSGWRHDLGPVDGLVRENDRENRMEGILFGPGGRDPEALAALAPVASTQGQRGESPYEAKVDPARMAELRAEFARGVGDRLDEAQRQMPSVTVGGVHFDENHLRQRLSSLNRAWGVKSPEIPRWKRGFMDHYRGDAVVPANTWSMFRPQRSDPSELHANVMGQVFGEGDGPAPPWGSTLQVSAGDVACYADRNACGDDTMNGGARQSVPFRDL